MTKKVLRLTRRSTLMKLSRLPKGSGRGPKIRQSVYIFDNRSVAVAHFLQKLLFLAPVWLHAHVGFEEYLFLEKFF
jgi:hypothetical protein